MATARILLLPASVLFFLGCDRSQSVDRTGEPGVNSQTENPPALDQPPFTSEAANSQRDESVKSTVVRQNPIQLDGRYQVDSIEFQGEFHVVQPGMPQTVQVSNGVFTAFTNGTPMETFSELKMIVNFSATPIELDLIRQRGERTESLPCILQVDGSELTIAMPMIQAEENADAPLTRPKSFDSKTGPFMVLTATRK